jgi:hypothetical protein
VKLSIEQIQELKGIIDEALRRLYHEDPELMEYAVNERSVVFRFGLYLNELLPSSSFANYNLDCEYNRNMGKPKRTKNFHAGVIPDVLLHRRNSNEENILVLEFKGFWNKDDRANDHKKIIDFTSQTEDNYYKYGLGGVVELEQGNYKVDYYFDYKPLDI